MERYNTKFIQQDLTKKMVFLGGPRQVGKTTLCKNLAKTYYLKNQYLNWDIDEHRKIIIQKLWHSNCNLIIFDELHKYPRWKQWIKGVFDDKHGLQRYLVTGSARLDLYRKGEDSLVGRYHYWRLHPITIDELPRGISASEGLERLLILGGFPEPFLQADEREARRWRKERFDRIVKEDLRDLQPIKEIQLLQLFAAALKERVGQLVVLANLATDLQISPTTAKAWLFAIERMYLAFPIYPLVNSIPRSILKPPKVYFYDNADATNGPAAKLENLVATTLLKQLNFIEDYYGYSCELRYIRDKDGREVDFVTIIDGKIIDLIEVKLSDPTISTSLKYFKNKLNPQKTTQIVGNLKNSFEKEGILVSNPIDFFNNPPWKNVKHS